MAATAKPRYSVLDLTYDQIDDIERKSGVPFGQWGSDDAPQGVLKPLMYAAFTGRPVEEFRSITPRQWVEQNTTKKDDGDPEA